MVGGGATQTLAAAEDEDANVQMKARFAAEWQLLYVCNTAADVRQTPTSDNNNNKSNKNICS